MLPRFLGMLPNPVFVVANPQKRHTVIIFVRLGSIPSLLGTIPSFLGTVPNVRGCII